MKPLFIWRRPVNFPVLVWLLDHTFATTADDISTESQVNQLTEYWYCHADQFSAVTQGNLDKVTGVYTSQVNEQFASCLSQPNIKKGHPQHDPLVAKGKYFIDWVCHQLTNRVLAAIPSCPTILDYNKKYVARGYYLSVQRYGPYGRNQSEWQSRYQACTHKGNIDVIAMKTKQSELDTITEVLSENSALSSVRLARLKELNEHFLEEIEALYTVYDAKEISEDELQYKLSLIELHQLERTEQLIGRRETIKLHGLDAKQALKNLAAQGVRISDD